MKIKKSITMLLAILGILMFSSLAYATNYHLTSGSNIEAYGYGADWYGDLKATESSSGYYSNITGVKVRCTVYKNGTVVTDTSKTDTSSPYYVDLSGSESSSSYSNNWKLVKKDYYKTGSSTSYTLDGTVTSTDSN